MQQVSRKLVIPLAVVVSITALYLAAILVPAWQARNRASRLLVCIRDLHPGITTEAQARERIKQLSRYEDSYPDSDGGQEAIYRFFNFGRLAQWANKILPDSWAQHLTLPWSEFDATFLYQGGLLIEIHTAEKQEDVPGMLHPTAASTTILYSHLGQRLRWLGIPESDFNGYSVHSQHTFGTDANGNPTGFTCCRERFITLDERATPTQLASSLNFQLHCLTSWRRCNDDHQLLP